jgi:hypothetical protein
MSDCLAVLKIKNIMEALAFELMYFRIFDIIYARTLSKIPCHRKLTVLDTLYAIEIRGEIALSSSKSLYDALKPTLAASFLENKISASVKNAAIVGCIL